MKRVITSNKQHTHTDGIWNKCMNKKLKRYYVTTFVPEKTSTINVITQVSGGGKYSFGVNKFSECITVIDSPSEFNTYDIMLGDHEPVNKNTFINKLIECGVKGKINIVSWSKIE